MDTVHRVDREGSNPPEDGRPLVREKRANQTAANMRGPLYVATAYRFVDEKATHVCPSAWPRAATRVLP